MKTTQMLEMHIRRFQNQIDENKEQLAHTLKAIAKNFEFTANQIETNSEHWFNDAEYIEHNCSWISEYSRRIDAAQHDMKILLDTLHMMESEAEK